MGKAKKSKEPEVPHNDVDDYLSELNSKSLQLEKDSSIGWQLLAMFILPLMIGLKLDDVFGTSPSLTITGIMIAAFGVSMLVYSAVKDTTKDVSETEGENQTNVNNKDKDD